MRKKLKKQFIKNKTFIIIFLVILSILIVLGAQYLINRSSHEPQTEDTTNNGTVTDTADEPIRPDASIVITENGFLEDRIELKSTNDPVNATVLIINASSSSATITFKSPDQKVSEPKLIEQNQVEVYFAEKNGNYELHNTNTNQIMRLSIQKE